MIFTVSILVFLAVTGYVRLFRVSEDDAQKMKLGDYAEYLRAMNIQDTEAVRAKFFAGYEK